MREELLNDVVARRFLLGQLPPEEQGRIEELAFEDRDTFAFLESVENDLIDEFIHGDLSGDDEQQFESHFLSFPGRRQNLKISRLLQRQLSKAATISEKRKFSLPGWFKEQSIWVQIPMTAAAALLLVIFAVWIFSRFWQGRQSTPIQAGHDRPVAIPSPSLELSPSQVPTSSPAHVDNKPKSLTPEKHKKPVSYAVLFPSASPRSAGVQQLTLAPDVPSVTIELALITQRNFRTYEAALENEAGTMLERWSKLKAERLTSGKALKIDVPVNLLKPQQSYRIVVSVLSKGKTDVVSSYPFEVSK